jgi:PAS domain S-box-containing protein
MPTDEGSAVNDKKRALVIAACGTLAVVVFAVDLLTPVGVEVWVLYLPVVLAAAGFNSARGVVTSALACAALVIIGAFISPPGDNPPWWDVLNRSMGLLAIGLTAWMGVVICRRAIRLTDLTTKLQTEIDERIRADAELRKSEERLQLAAQGSGMGTWDLDLRSGDLFWSEAQFQLLGYKARPDGKATLEMWRSRVHPDDLSRVLQAQEQAQREHSLYCSEYQICRADDGQPVWLAVFGRYRYAYSGQAVRFAGVCFDITNRKRLEHETLEIAAREQLRIGQELHDGLGQELTGLGLIASTLAQRLQGDSSESRIASRLITGFDRVHQQVRNLARGLMPVHVETQGLAAALQDLAERLMEQSGTPIKFRSQDGIDACDHAAATQLFHIAQEATANALRHGHPRNIALNLTSTSTDFCLTIQDDGVGMCDKPKEGKGMGLQIMRYRADQIGGTLNISKADGGGTLVTCTLPMRKANDNQQP